MGEKKLEEEISALKNENEELRKEIERLKGLLKRDGRVKDSRWMTERREAFTDMYTNGMPKNEIIERMQISPRTYDRLLQYAKKTGKADS